MGFVCVHVCSGYVRLVLCLLGLVYHAAIQDLPVSKSVISQLWVDSYSMVTEISIKVRASEREGVST